ncbi:hypothetical protein MTER_22200 [Mycolicibacter terrae]|uniref:Uncharacterized protein n=1 Tax=Mycolicibacter terrae TaxID=1788 RepID=A0AAD1HWX9_9MYCO|nr:hypothetical protein [Mycolicibacter terrae]BBX22809.1 hypothetical protein MTER_22200 [Mycolicibacter terrae]SNV71293.1 Uncharacterised protein [Mycolicibacter terrae]
MVKLRPWIVLVLFVVGAAAGLVGDHSHVVTGTTEYLPPSHAVPFVWSSPIWFAVMVGAGTAILAELRLHLPAVRSAVTVRQGAAGVAAVLGSYVVTAMLHTAPQVPITTLICAFAVLTFCALGDRPAIVCGILAAVCGPAIEIAIAAAGHFRYADDSDALFGVAPWLIPLYFAFGIVAALIGEIAAGTRRST